MSISVITTNVYPERIQIATIIRNLGEQTYKDFEWIFVDAYYLENKEIVKELSQRAGLRRVVHAPFVGGSHVGRQFHWECYNDALLLSSEKHFLRLGVYRYFHHSVVQFAVDQAQNNTWVSLRQQDIRDFDASLSHQEIVNRYGLETNTVQKWSQMVSHCGMFSFSRDKMVEICGNNEALIIHHWEDVDLNCRWTHLGEVKLLSLDNAFLRVYHSKSHPYKAKNYCQHSDNPNCLVWAKNSHELENYPQPNMEWIEHRGFRWAKCPVCGAVAVGYCDKYFEWLKTEPQALIAPIGVGGVGRDIRILDEDMAKLSTLESKWELLASSHSDPRYLGN